MAPACGYVALWREGSEKVQWPLLIFLSGRELSPILALMPDTSVPPCMPLLSFELLPWWCWNSEGVHMSKFGMGPLRGTTKGVPQFFSPTPIPLVFIAKSYWCFSSWHFYPGLRGWDSSLPRHPPELLIPTSRCGTCLFYISVTLCLLHFWIDVVSLIP